MYRFHYYISVHRRGRKKSRKQFIEIESHFIEIKNVRQNFNEIWI